MNFQQYPKFTLTPEGIFLEGQPLNKSMVDEFPESVRRNLLCAFKKKAAMTEEELAPPDPRRPKHNPNRALLEIHLAFASRDLFVKYNHRHNPKNGQFCSADELSAAPADRATGYAEQAGRAAGRAAEVGGNAASVEAARENGKQVIAQVALPLPAPMGVPIFRPRNNNNDDPLGGGTASHSRSYSWPWSLFPSGSNSSNGANKDSYDEFCRKRKQYCFSYCQYELDFPGRSGHDNMLKFRACVRKCMNDVGCDY